MSFIVLYYNSVYHFISCIPTSPRANRDAYSGMDTPGSKRKLYSAVPGRHYVVVKSYQPQGEEEITLYKNDRVKGTCISNKNFTQLNHMLLTVNIDIFKSVYTKCREKLVSSRRCGFSCHMEGKNSQILPFGTRRCLARASNTSQTERDKLERFQWDEDFIW